MDSGSLVSLVNSELRSLVRIWCCSKHAINNFLPVWKGSDVQVGVGNKGDPVHEYVVQEVRSTSTASGVLSYSDTVRAPFDIQLCIKIIGIDQSFPSFWCTGIGFGSNWLCDRYRACGSLWHAPGYNLVLLLCCFGFRWAAVGNVERRWRLIVVAVVWGGSSYRTSILRPSGGSWCRRVHGSPWVAIKRRHPLLISLDHHGSTTKVRC